MTTLTINSDSKEALSFIKYARTLPFVAKETKKSTRRLKPEIEQSILRSMQGIDVKTFDNIEDMFKDLGI
jgi:hypothetical protein